MCVLFFKFPINLSYFRIQQIKLSFIHIRILILQFFFFFNMRDFYYYWSYTYVLIIYMHKTSYKFILIFKNLFFKASLFAGNRDICSRESFLLFLRCKKCCRCCQQWCCKWKIHGIGVDTVYYSYHCIDVGVLRNWWICYVDGSSEMQNVVVLTNDINGKCMFSLVGLAVFE